MKKFTRVCLTICGILAGLGLVLCVVSGAMGFGFQQMRSMAGNGAFRYGWQIDNIKPKVGIKPELESGDWSSFYQEFGADEIENLDIQFDFGTVKIEPSTGENIRVDASYRSKWDKYIRTIEWKLDGDTLKIRDSVDKKIMKLFTHGDEDAVLTIQIPAEKIFEKVNMDIGAVRMNSNVKISGEEMDITIGAGELTAAYVDVKELNLECGSGEVDLKNVTADEVDIDCGVGQITMSMEGAQSDYDYEVNCGIGQVKIGDFEYSGLGENRKISNNGNKNIDIDCGVGEVEITFGTKTL